MNEMNAQPIKQLRRTRNGRVVGGVCSGVGEYIGIDPNILRIALAIASFFGGLGFGVYAVAWLLLPEEDKQISIVQDLLNKQQQKRKWQQSEPANWPQDTNWQDSNWQPPAAPQSPVGSQPQTTPRSSSDDQPPAGA